MSNKLATVAEWKGIAIVEVSGNVPKFWQGTKYYTDGLTNLIRQNFEQRMRGMIEYVGLRSERDAYRYIESLTPVERIGYLSIRQVLETIGEDEQLIESVLEDFKYGCHFDEGAGIFVVNNPGIPGYSRNLVHRDPPKWRKVELGQRRINPRWFLDN